MFHQACYVCCSSEVVSHILQSPCKCQYQHSRHHLLKTLRQTIHTLAEWQRTPNKIIPDSKYEGFRRTYHQSRRGITGSKGFSKPLAIIETACIYHTNYTADDKNHNRHYQVWHPTLFLVILYLLCLINRISNLIGCKEVSLFSIVLMQGHIPIVQPHKGNDDYHQQCQQCIEVERYRLYEDADAILILYKSRHSSRPWRYGCDDADRCCRRVDEVC